MTRRIRVEEISQTLWGLLTAEAHIAAEENALIAREEQAALGPWLRRWADTLREERGKGTRVLVSNLVERAHAEALAVWSSYTGESARDATWFAQDEIAAVAREDPNLGELTVRAREAALRAPNPEVGPIVAFFDMLFAREQPVSDVGLPRGAAIDARRGEGGRSGLPTSVLESFDFYYRVEAGDWGTSRVYSGELGQAVWVVRFTTDGDTAGLEVFDQNGSWLAGRREFGRLSAWDRLPLRTRLGAAWTAFDAPAREEGFSEPDERAAAGQPPLDWSSEAKVDSGQLTYEGRLLDAVEANIDPEWRPLAVAAFDYLWDVHLFFAADPDRPLELGPDAQGVLRLGRWTRKDGRTFLTADWRDIDDGSYVLYFLEEALGLRLAIVQFDN